MANDCGKKLDLSDVFKSKSKKKAPKSSNLNANLDGVPKADDRKEKVKNKDADAQWAEDEDVAVTELKVAQVVNMASEEKTEEDDTGAQAWAVNKKVESKDLNDRDKKRFPTLVTSMKVNPRAQVEDADVSLKTHKNKFDILNEDDDDVEVRGKGKTGPIVSKKQGERQTDAVKRITKESQKAAKERQRQKAREVGDDSDSSEEDEEIEVEEQKTSISKKRTPAKVKSAMVSEDIAKVEEPDDVAADRQIEADLVAARAKYADRMRLPLKDLHFNELRAEPKAKKEAKKNKFDTPGDDGDKKMLVAPDDW